MEFKQAARTKWPSKISLIHHIFGSVIQKQGWKGLGKTIESDLVPEGRMNITHVTAEIFVLLGQICKDVNDAQSGYSSALMVLLWKVLPTAQL